IRQMMKQSNRFLSLSGLSGIFAGLYALVGSYLGNLVIGEYLKMMCMTDAPDRNAYIRLMVHCILICAGVLILSIATALVLSARRAKKTGQSLFDHTALRLVINMFIPLAAGGFFCLAMIYHGDERLYLVGPSMLIFYGLALVNASKYTLHDIRYLGIIEVLLGLVACFYPGYGLVFWAIGFGLMHIVYGTIMWFKYERNS
ncbi:MAG: hypothetical protein IT236_17090, partial [Bacteroidia bacterium]|nr:hypothetical protein [Bacteroidia bacterium]